MPPVTPSRTCLPASGDLLDTDTLGSLEGDLALGDLLQGDGQWLGLQPARLDERWNELPPTLAELAVVRVDLAGPLRRQDDQGGLGVHPLRPKQGVDLRLDHVPLLCSLRYDSMIASTSSAARERSSFTTTWSNQDCCGSSLSNATSSRSCSSSSCSVPLATSRRFSSSRDGGTMNTRTASGTRSFTMRDPWTSISSSTSRPSARALSTGSASVPDRCPNIAAHSRNASSRTSPSNSVSETNR